MSTKTEMKELWAQLNGQPTGLSYDYPWPFTSQTMPQASKQLFKAAYLLGLFIHFHFNLFAKCSQINMLEKRSAPDRSQIWNDIDSELPNSMEGPQWLICSCQKERQESLMNVLTFKMATRASENIASRHFKWLYFIRVFVGYLWGACFTSVIKIVYSKKWNYGIKF